MIGISPLNRALRSTVFGIKRPRIAASLFLAVSAGTLAHASTIVSDANYQTNTLAPNDDGSTGAIALGFNVNFFGTTYSNLYVNNNGNVTFGSALSTYTPFGLTGSGIPP